MTPRARQTFEPVTLGHIRGHSSESSMKRLLIVASAAHSLFSLQLGDAYAGGPYDGEWTGSRHRPAGDASQPLLR